MKKLVFILLTLLMCLSASAQFVVYRSLEPVNSNNGANSYNNSNYNNYYQFNYTPPQRSQSQPQPQSSVISIRGYYVKDNQWNTVLLRVSVINDDVYVVGIKRNSTGWSNSKIKAYSTELMQQEIKDAFDYYIGDYVYGKIYF